MITSSSDNIAGPEVEAALLSHDAVAECALFGVPDDERGSIVEAHVVLDPGLAARARWPRPCKSTSKRQDAAFSAAELSDDRQSL